MSFRARLASLCAALAVLGTSLALGIIFSPDRVQARTTGRPLLALGAQQVTGIDILDKGALRVSLRRQAAGWSAQAGGPVYPASTDRITLFLRTLTALSRGTLVSTDPAHLAELSLSEENARVLVLHLGAGQPDVTLLIGKRGPGGDADYVRVRGEGSAHLVRGSLSYFLAQDGPSWYELHVLPAEVQGATIASYAVSGRLALGGPEPGVREGPYAVARAKGADQWTVVSENKPANPIAAAAMAHALAQLEGLDFAGAPPARQAPGGLRIEVTTLEGKTFVLDVRPSPDPGKALVSTSWSPWTYVVNALPLQRAVFPLSRLLPRP